MNPLLKARIINRMNHHPSYESKSNTTTTATTPSTAQYQQHHHQQQQQQQQQQQALPDHTPSHHHHHHHRLIIPNRSLTEFDVINGRGQGAQRHPGNIKYRTLVFLNKELYASCPRGDKSKISKGIVAAVRELGGRFLELDNEQQHQQQQHEQQQQQHITNNGAGGNVEEQGAYHYHDIGDKKAWAKTSQALREGQSKIRQQQQQQQQHCQRDLRKGGARAHHTNNNIGPALRTISGEGYFGHSVQLLESLVGAKNDDENDDALPLQSQQQQQQQQQQHQHQYYSTSSPLPRQAVVSPCPSPMNAALSLVELSCNNNVSLGRCGCQSPAFSTGSEYCTTSNY